VKIDQNILWLVLLLWTPGVWAQENPYCTESAEVLATRFEQRLLRFDSPWQIRSVAIEEARLMLACFVDVRDRARAPVVR